MHVIKRNGAEEKISFDKITERITLLADGLKVEPIHVAQKTIEGIFPGIHTSQLDIIAARQAESLALEHPDYSKLAARVLVSNLHKNTLPSFAEQTGIARCYVRFSESKIKYINANADALDDMIAHDRDYMFDYVGFRSIEATYLLKSTDNVVVDRPQYVYMRAAVQIYEGDLKKIKIYYDLLSKHLVSAATPILFNSCMENAQMISCFLLGLDDSEQGIMRNASHCATISKGAGGIGIHAHKIRCAGQLIRSTGGGAAGVPQMMHIHEAVANTFNQGGKRKGSFVFYLEPWHGDIREFLRLRLTQGRDADRTRDLFIGLWVPDLFMKRLVRDEDWSLFSEDTAPGLSDVYDGMQICRHCGHVIGGDISEYVDPVIGAEFPCDHDYERVNVFTNLYEKYEREGRAIDVVKASDIMKQIAESFADTGTPYICYKDHVNRQTMQENIGTIKSSNLCTEIMEYSDADSTACCTLSSLPVNKYYRAAATYEVAESASSGEKDADVGNKLVINEASRGYFDHAMFHKVVQQVVRALDVIVDNNSYPTKECRTNASAYRPIGLGIQGLADLFCMMRIPFDSAEAARVDFEIFETMYHAALTASAELAEENGPYSAFSGSPASRGILRMDKWVENQLLMGRPGIVPYSGRYDWDIMRTRCRRGLAHSLLIAPMPTMSTAQIMGNNESFDPFNSNLFTKTFIGGKVTRMNNHMVRHLIELGLWNQDIVHYLMENNGSILGCEAIPHAVREIYKTIWEIKQSLLAERAAIRASMIDQSMSLNMNVENTSYEYLTSMMIGNWNKGLMTGSYYIRSRPATSAMKNYVRAAEVVVETEPVDNVASPRDDVCPIGCTSCGS